METNYSLPPKGKENSVHSFMSDLVSLRIWLQVTRAAQNLEEGGGPGTREETK